MKLNTKAIYALVAITNMANKGNLEPVKLETISEEEKISNHFLEQIFRSLRIAGIVKSYRGPGGGYMLTSNKIKYLSILEAIGEEVHINKNNDAVRNVTKQKTDVFIRLDAIDDEVEKLFKKVSIDVKKVRRQAEMVH